MAEILRSWLCLNSRCGKKFDAWEDNPACTKCGCVRVQWVPGGGHISGTAKAADAELRALADCFRMDDINSARRGEAAKPKLAQPAVDQRGARATTFAPGFAAVPHPERAICVPSSTGVNFKAKVQTGQPLAHSRSVPGIHANTAIEARHRPVKS